MAPATEPGVRRRLAGLVAGVVAALTADGSLAMDLTPSGHPVPRWVSLRVDKAYARIAPDDDARVAWTFTARDLPLQVIAETRDWRRVCGPDGAVAWLKAANLKTERYAVNFGSRRAALLAARRPFAPVVARVARGGRVRLQGCGSQWCRVAADGAAGWTPIGELWGTTSRPLCRDRRTLAAMDLSKGALDRSQRSSGKSNGRLASFLKSAEGG